MGWYWDVLRWVSALRYEGVLGEEIRDGKNRQSTISEMVQFWFPPSSSETSAKPASRMMSA